MSACNGSWSAFCSNVAPPLCHGLIVKKDLKSIPLCFQCDPVGRYLYQLIFPDPLPLFHGERFPLPLMEGSSWAGDRSGLVIPRDRHAVQKNLRAHELFFPISRGSRKILSFRAEEILLRNRNIGFGRCRILLSSNRGETLGPILRFALWSLSDVLFGHPFDRLGPYLIILEDQKEDHTKSQET